MDNKDFFKTQTSSSLIKAKIVAEYFPQYSRIILKSSQPHEEIRYMDLFSGPGKYEDGSYSTPLLIGEACASDPILRENVLLAFNDKYYSEQLKHNFNELFPPGTFKHEPHFGNRAVGEDQAIDKYLSKPAEKRNTTPTLLFFDPWGYKEIDTRILARFLEHWGNEIFLFFNIKRIHAAVKNNKFDELMASIFPATINKIREDRKYKGTVHQRLNLIIENLANEFRIYIKGKFFHCAFKFQEEDSIATSHFIIHFCKHQRGYELVKQIYYDFDNIGANLEKEGVYTFDAKEMGKSKESEIMFNDSNVVSLSNDLINTFKNQTLTARSLFEQHHIKTKYCASHYAKTLRDMAFKQKINSKFTDNKAHKVSVLITNECVVTFP